MRMLSYNPTHKVSDGAGLKYHIGALLAVTAWGDSFICTKVLLQNGLSPVEAYIYRFIIAYLFVLILCPKPILSNSFKDEIKFILVGICGGSVYFIAENTAVNYTLVTNVSLIVTTAPLLASLILGAMYKNERPSGGFLFGSVLAFLGVALVIFNSSFVVKIMPLGDMLSLLAALCWAFYSILLKPLNAVYSAWFITRKTFFYGVLTALPFLAIEPELVPLEVLCRPAVIGNLLFLSVFASLIAYFLWAQTVKHLGVIKASNYLYISPIVTLVLSAVMLDERVTWVGYTGCAIIMCGVILSEKLNNRSSISAKNRRPR
ncbi:MAG: DMT family transporter [Muribaculaceae bacterium]|nr:DMT family transporter [Muribaculaceae bacterium]